jgi:Phytanoyl-CoA dioxygenase (PhyH)
MALKSNGKSQMQAIVISQGQYLSVLVESPLLGSRKACRVRAAIESNMCSGLGLTLEEGSVLLVLEVPVPLRSTRLGPQVILRDIDIIGARIDFAHARERLVSIIGADYVGSISERAARHALLFILEAHDPQVRNERISLLRASLCSDHSKLSEPNYNLSADEKTGFIRDGAIIRRQFIPRPLVESARGVINAWHNSSLFDIGLIERYTQKTFAPELGSDPTLLDVYYSSGIEKLVASLVRPDSIQLVTTAQVQIRLPESQSGGQQPAKALHVDGVACPHLDLCELRTFTLLVGVLLSETVHSEAGALQYLPGAHLEMARWFREKWEPGTKDQIPASLEGWSPAYFCGKPGDIILMHHLVPHAVGANLSTVPRIMIYFRVKHEHHDTQKLASLRDPWLEFPGLRVNA